MDHEPSQFISCGLVHEDNRKETQDICDSSDSEQSTLKRRKLDMSIDEEFSQVTSMNVILRERYVMEYYHPFRKLLKMTLA